MSEGHIDFDLGNLRDPNDPAPAGAYTIECQDAEDTTSQKSGRRMFHFEYQIVGDGENAGKYVHDYCIIDGNDYASQLGRFRVQEMARHLGLDKVDNIQQFINQSFEVELSEEAPTEGYNRGSNRIARIY